MLYNRDWDKIAKPDITIENLIAWLEKQPCEKGYNYWSPNDCLLDQWIKSIGAVVEYTDIFTIPIRSCILVPRPRTYGAALARARAITAGRL